LAGAGDGSDLPPAPGAGGSWFGSLFGSTAKARKADNQPGTWTERASPDAIAPVKTPTVVEETASLRAREEAKYLRRLQVCDRLKDIAEQTGDAALGRRADELNARAEELYLKRTANLPAARAIFESDRKTLQKHLGPAAGSRETAAGGMIQVSSKNGRAAAKEEQ
jgi:hypothetical protein